MLFAADRKASAQQLLFNKYEPLRENCQGKMEAWEKKMDKRFEEEELDKLLEEEYIKEAEVIEEALLADDDLIDKDMTDEEVKDSYQKLVRRLKAEGLYREDEKDGESTPEETLPEEEKTSGEKIISMPVSAPKDKYARMTARHKFIRVAGVAVVCVLGVFAASMTSEANRNYFVETMKYLAGNETQMIVDSNSENEKPVQDETKAIRDIEIKLEAKIPEIMYRPGAFRFRDYFIYENTQIAVMEYEYNGNIVTFSIDNEKNRNNSDSWGLHGTDIDKIVIDDIGVEAEVIEVKEEEGISSYTAQWEMDECIYQLSGKMEKEEMKKIIRSLLF